MLEMDEPTGQYLEALENSLKLITFDRTSGESFRFEELFYPLLMDEGKYAFQSYTEQMDRARKSIPSHSLDKESITAQTTVIRNRITDYLSQEVSVSNEEDEAPSSLRDRDDDHTGNNEYCHDENVEVLAKNILGKIKSQQYNLEMAQQTLFAKEEESERKPPENGTDDSAAEKERDVQRPIPDMTDHQNNRDSKNANDNAVRHIQTFQKNKFANIKEQQDRQASVSITLPAEQETWESEDTSDNTDRLISDEEDHGQNSSLNITEHEDNDDSQNDHDDTVRHLQTFKKDILARIKVQQDRQVSVSMVLPAEQETSESGEIENNADVEVSGKEDKVQGRSSDMTAYEYDDTDDSDNVDRNIQALGKKILGKIKVQQLSPKTAQQLVTTGKKSSEEKNQEEDNILECEKQYDHSSLIIRGNAQESRILAIASAGHGKTTLLRRIALYYCHPFSTDENHLEIRKRYSLSGNFLPCLIQLRDITDKNYSIVNAIEKSIASVFKNSEAYRNTFDNWVASAFQRWVYLLSIQNKLLLLIDGLDELSDSMRFHFLYELDHYLVDNPQTPVIMTSRVAGLSDPKIQNILRKMRFRGRSIIPLTDENAKKYSERWIDITQPVEQREQLKLAIEQIFKQSKFRYLQEFTSTPLELLLILKQIANDSFSLNRFQMFRDTLWEYFTNHVKQYTKKRAVFEDTMTLLSFIAYRMQLNDSMFISVQELEKISQELRHLSFHTDLIKDGTLEDYREVLDSIAANVGIIERDDRTSDVIYTFPIRAYQEFLTAHACCHLRLNTSLSRPDPCSIFRQYLNDSRWISITNFALSDLETNNQQEFDAILRMVFQQVDDIEQLRMVVEADLSITKDHALVLCERFFSDQIMTGEQKELLIACLNAKSSYAYVYALNELYQAAFSDNQYLEANALSTIIWEYNSGHSAYQKAWSFLQSEKKSRIKLGAEMISLMCRTMMDEVSVAYKDKTAQDFVISEELLMTLAINAALHEDIFSVMALTNIWLSKMQGAEKAKQLLSVDLAAIAVAELEKDIPMVQKLCLSGMDAVKNADYRYIREIVVTLGSFPAPADIKNFLRQRTSNLFVSMILEIMHQDARKNMDIDHVAIAIACLYYCWDEEQFMEAWIYDICRGIPSRYVRKDVYSVREQNHFDLIRKEFGVIEQAYRDAHQDELNVYYDETIDESEASSMQKQNLFDQTKEELMKVGQTHHDGE